MRCQTRERNKGLPILISFREISSRLCNSSRTGCGNVGYEIRRNNRWIVSKTKKGGSNIWSFSMLPRWLTCRLYQGREGNTLLRSKYCWREIEDWCNFFELSTDFKRPPQVWRCVCLRPTRQLAFDRTNSSDRKRERERRREEETKRKRERERQEEDLSDQ